MLEMVKIPRVVAIKMGTRDMARWLFDYADCSAADRCEDGSVGNDAGQCGGDGGTGSNSTGAVLAGICDSGGCPGVGCRNGYWYKTCCQYIDNDSSGSPTTGDTLNGVVSGCNC